MLLHEQVDRRAYANRPEYKEQNKMHEFHFPDPPRRGRATSLTIPRYRNATTKPVTIILAIASGSRNFHPKAISWS